MRETRLRTLALFAAGLWMMAATWTASAQSARQPRETHSAPLMAQLSRFTAVDVPTLGPAETEVPPLKSDQPVAPGLPGNGMAQHPMLYIGEGYNKILLINDGKIAWTYSTGPGWEYDDAWMLSNGNILFTRMQYVAEVTPDEESSLALRRAAGNRNPHLPADRIEQGHVRAQWPTAQTDGGEHQEQQG